MKKFNLVLILFLISKNIFFQSEGHVSVTRHYNFICYLVLVVVFITSSCKKPQYKRYEEDPDFSEQPPRQRIRGDWFVENYTFRGQSVVDKYNLLFGNKIDIRKSVISAVYDSRDDEDYITFNSPTTATKDCTFDESFFIFQPQWGNDSATTMEFYTPMHFNTPIDPIIKWRVTKLFKNQMNIALMTDTGEFKIILSK